MEREGYPEDPPAYFDPGNMAYMEGEGEPVAVDEDEGETDGGRDR